MGYFRKEFIFKYFTGRIPFENKFYESFLIRISIVILIKITLFDHVLMANPTESLFHHIFVWGAVLYYFNAVMNNLYCYFKLTTGVVVKCQDKWLPDPNGPLSPVVPSEAILNANDAYAKACTLRNHTREHPVEGLT